MENFKYNTDKYELLKSEDGYMVFDIDNEDYICDNEGNNLWDTLEEVSNLFKTLTK